LQIQGQRVQVAKLEAERSALSRLDRIKADQGARATALEKEAGASELRANLIEYNLDAVDAALDAVNAGEASSAVSCIAQQCTALKSTPWTHTTNNGCSGCGAGCRREECMDMFVEPSIAVWHCMVVLRG
jgi:hypothetical protein